MVILTFFIIGSPVEVRMRQLDAERISALGSIQYQIIYYWQSKEVLPDKLSDLTDAISGFRAPRDPEYGIDYEYEKKTDTSFTICGSFSRASSDTGKVSTPYYPMHAPVTYPIAPSPDFIKGGVDTEWNWVHGVGRSCFERTIDKERYPSLRAH